MSALFFYLFFFQKCFIVIIVIIISVSLLNVACVSRSKCEYAAKCLVLVRVCVCCMCARRVGRHWQQTCSTREPPNKDPSADDNDDMRMPGCMAHRRHGWVNEWMYVWMYVFMYVCMYVCVGVCMYVCMDGWRGKWMDGSLGSHDS